MSQEKTLFLVILKGEDSDAYYVHTNLSDAKISFYGGVESGYYNAVYLVETLPGDEIGFGSYGDIYGGVELLGWWENGEMETSPGEEE